MHVMALRVNICEHYVDRNNPGISPRRYTRSRHLQARQITNTQPHVKHAERPKVDVGCSESQWLFFLDEWKSSKRRTSLDASKIVDELRASCTKELRRFLFEFVGGSALETISENDLLVKIKSAAVVGKNKAVRRKEFYNLQSSPGEHINYFVARLKAEHYNFTIKCTNDSCHNQNNPYAEAMLADQLTTGILDKDIQEELLAKDN